MPARASHFMRHAAAGLLRSLDLPRGAHHSHDMRAPLPASSALLLVSFALSACSTEASPPQTTANRDPAAPTSATAANAVATSTPSASAATVAASPTKPTRALRGVLMITIDSLRADMPWTGYGRDIAPNLTAFAKKSAVYTRFYSISSYTAMSLGGMLTGRYPSEVERSGYFFGNYPDSVEMFPELLQKAGVRTVTGHAHFYFDQKAGFRQGFDVYEMVPGIKVNNTTDESVTSPAHTELMLKLLGDKANTGGKFFAWFHMLDPHDQYIGHQGISWGKKARDLYDGEITFTDKHIGKVFEFVEQQDWGKDVAIIISSDHGEAFGEHKQFRHGFEVWENLVHVPLMVYLPGMEPRRIDTPRSAIDLAPTILEALEVAPSADLRGKSLLEEIRTGKAEPRDVIVDLPRTSDNDRRRAIVRGNYKLVAYGDDDAFELYDVVADPGETKDLKRDKKDVFEEMKAAYKAASEKIVERCPKMTEKLKGKKKGKKC